MRRALATLAVVGIAFASSTSSAQERTSASYFSDGVRLMNQGQAHYRDACIAFEHALALGSGVGSKFNLADCYDKTRRPAQALPLFREVEDITRQAGQKERSQVAKERVSDVERRVPKLLVRAPWLEAHGDSVLLLDDKPLSVKLVDTPMPLDFGKHTVVARLAGNESSAAIDLETDHQLETITLQLPAPTSPVASTSTASPAPDHTQRNLGFLAGGVGVAAAIVGGSVALAARLHYNSVTNDDGCNGAHVCRSPSAPADIQGARTEADVGGVTALVGLALVATGVALWATAPSAPRDQTASAPSSAAFRIAPSVGFDHASVVASGSF